MNREVRAAAVLALCCTVAGAGLTGCDEAPAADTSTPPSSVTSEVAEQPGKTAFAGTRKIDVDGRSVHVSCAGSPGDGEPVVILLHGGGDSLEKLSGIQKSVSERHPVCSYDRLGAGDSDQPAGPQTLDSTGQVLTAVIDEVAGDAPVVLAGHSLGGVIAARYAPDHRDTVKGLVLMDATSPTQKADLTSGIPESATGAAAEVRAGTLATLEGQNPERLTVPDGEVRSAGDIPAEVIQHGQPYLEAAVPEYGPALEQAWAEGQRKWLAVSDRGNLSIAVNSDHYIYVGDPELVVRTIHRVAEEAAAVR